MRYTIEYLRRGHRLTSRIHTNSYAKAQAHYLQVLADPECLDVTLTDREGPYVGEFDV